MRKVRRPDISTPILTLITHAVVVLEVDSGVAEAAVVAVVTLFVVVIGVVATVLVEFAVEEVLVTVAAVPVVVLFVVLLGGLVVPT